MPISNYRSAPVVMPKPNEKLASPQPHAKVAMRDVSSVKPAKKAARQADPFELAANGDVKKEPNYAINRMRLWQEFLKAAYDVRLDIDYTLPMSVNPAKIEESDDPKTRGEKEAVNAQANLENDKNPEIFLTKYMTDIFTVDGDRLSSVFKGDIKAETLIQDKKGLVCEYQYIRLHYEHEKNTFNITNLRGDLTSQRAKDDEIYANNTLCENSMAALILAQSAKAAGWTSVNFGNTTDPAKRYALQVACQYVGIDCSSEKVDLQALPDTFHHEKLENIIKHSINEFLPSMNQQIWVEKPSAKDTQSAGDLDSAFLGNINTPAPQPSL